MEIDGECFIAGVTSGGSGDAHSIGGESFDTRVDTLAVWIDSVVGNTTPDPNPDPNPDPDPNPNPDPDPTLDDHADAPGVDATPILLDANGAGTGTGTLEDVGDRDVFSVALAETSAVAIQLNGTLDTYLRVYDANGNLIAENDDAGGTLNSALDVTLDAGTYYISAGAYSDSETGDYSVSVQSTTLSDPDPDPNPDPSPDDHADAPGAEATPIQLDPSGAGSATGTLEETGDRDVFSVEVSGTSSVSIQLNGALDTYLRVYDANGNLIAENDDADDTLNSALDVTLEAGTYYISAGSYADSETGDYSVSVQATTLGDPDPDTPPFDDAQQVDLVDNRARVNGRLRNAGDDAIYSFTADADGEMILTARGRGDLDTVLTVFDADGNEVAFNDDWRGTDSRVRLNVQAGETYYVRVSGFADSVGRYRLNFHLRTDVVVITNASQLSATDAAFSGSRDWFLFGV